MLQFLSLAMLWPEYLSSILLVFHSESKDNSSNWFGQKFCCCLQGEAYHRKKGESLICWKRIEYKNNIIYSVGLKCWQLLFKKCCWHGLYYIKIQIYCIFISFSVCSWHIRLSASWDFTSFLCCKNFPLNGRFLCIIVNWQVMDL